LRLLSFQLFALTKAVRSFISASVEASVPSQATSEPIAAPAHKPDHRSNVVDLITKSVESGACNRRISCTTHDDG
jgi:hypothetical protein